MHVAFLITRSDAMGGASVHVHDMACALNRSGHRATVILGGKGGEVTQRMQQSQISLIHVPRLRRSIHPLRDAAAVWAVRSALASVKPDLVSTHTAKAGFVGRLAAASLGIPALYTPHGWTISNRISRWAGPAFRLAERASAPLAKRIINVCEAERELALQHGIAEHGKLDVIHNGVVDVPWAMRATPAAEKPRLTMVARFESPKDHALLLAALAPLKHLAWTLDLVGGGPLAAETRVQARRFGLSQRVTFHGSGKPVAPILADSQIFVLASRSEGFPRSILEAMRAGLPVVASDVGGAGEAVVHGKSGIVVPSGDIAAMTGALEILIRNAELRQRMGASGRERYEAHFTFDRMFEKTLNAYREVLHAAEPIAATAMESATASSSRRRS